MTSQQQRKKYVIKLELHEKGLVQFDAGGPCASQGLGSFQGMQVFGEDG